MMTQELTEKLWHKLHSCPEISGHEEQTKQIIIDFLLEHTALEVYPCGAGFYAAHRELNTTKSAVAIRADYDAVTTPDGSAKHLCGHDGHAAALCGLALAIEDQLAKGQNFEKNIFLLFQPAEETGEGAKSCLELFEKEHIDEIYGAHNLPGVPFGQVTTKAGTFACSSRGLILKLEGKPAHAAYPENGVSPAHCIGEILCDLQELADSKYYSGMTLCTVIGTSMGQKAFGMAASDGEIWLTLRAEYENDLESLQEKIVTLSKELAQKDKLQFSYELQDVFPETKNDEDCAKKVLDVTEGSLLKEPMRWSEDFGHYLKVCKGAFFGIGAGEEHPALHTEKYCYPTGLLMPTVETFLSILKK